MSVFQNTIAYATFLQEDASITLAEGEWTEFNANFQPVIVNGVEILQKEINILNNGLMVSPSQTGTYYVDFSFIANEGDGETYSVAPYVNTDRIGHYALDFHQQATQQRYEVSMCFIIPMTRKDTLSFKIYVASLPTLDLTIKDVKLTMFNLQQLGIH